MYDKVADSAELGPVDGPAGALFDDREPRYAPQSVIVISGGRGVAYRAAVDRYLFHPAGSHKGPIRPDVPALELQTAAGSRWYGCLRAYINAELRMVVIGCSSRDEVRRAWKVVPVGAAGQDRYIDRSRS